MPLTIRNPRACLLAEEVAATTGESKTQAVIVALQERLERLSGRRTAPDVFTDIMAIAERCRALPTRDGRCPDEILGYDEHGVPSHGR